MVKLETERGITTKIRYGIQASPKKRASPYPNERKNKTVGCQKIYTKNRAHIFHPQPSPQPRILRARGLRELQSGDEEEDRRLKHCQKVSRVK